jgi:hypothetical protein
MKFVNDMLALEKENVARLEEERKRLGILYQQLETMRNDDYIKFEEKSKQNNRKMEEERESLQLRIKKLNEQYEELIGKLEILQDDKLLLSKKK